MKILAVDCTAKPASVAVLEDGKVLSSAYTNTGLTHSQTLVPMVDSALRDAQLSLDTIDYYAINAGPGSFTGVRIGVAAVKGLAFADDLPCVPVSTLESMAYNMTGGDCIVCAAMDARCSQVYNALFRVSGDKVERLCDDRALSLGDLKQALSVFTEPVVLVGDGAKLCYDFFGDETVHVRLAPANKRIQTASSVAMAAWQAIKEGRTVTAEALMPSYLRLPQAQRELNKRLGRE